MGYDMRPECWDGQERPKISAKLKSCRCGESLRAHVDTVGMWSADCHHCGVVYMGADFLGCETWQELVRGWNAVHDAKYAIDSQPVNT